MKKLCTWTVLLALAAVASAAGVEVPVIVAEPAGIARTAEPVSGGISLPPQTFKPGQAKLALFDGDKQVPAQITSPVAISTSACASMRWERSQTASVSTGPSCPIAARS